MEAESDIFETKTFEQDKGKEYWINAVDNGECSDSLYGTVEYLKTLNAQPVSVRLFGNRSNIQQAKSLIQSLPDKMLCPALMMVEDNRGQLPLRIQIHAVSGMNEKPIYFEEMLVGRMFEDSFAAYYMLTVSPDPINESNDKQAKGVFENAQKILTSLGLSFSNTIRTWLYAADILSWYDGLNRARNDFFTAHRIYDHTMPASTGIGIDNPAGAAMTAQFLAVRPKTADVGIEAAMSPLQNPALDYKSSFSRGIKVLYPDHQRLSVSGTASIDKEGKTVFVDDAAAQIDLTMRVVHAILDKAGMTWQDAVSSLVYFKQQKDFVLFDAYCQQHNIALPHSKVCADICRDDLLFELELEAMKSRK